MAYGGIRVFAATPLGGKRKSAGPTRMSALSGRIVCCCGIIALRHCLTNPKVQGRLGFICMNCGLLKIALVSALIVPHRLWRTPSKRGEQRL